ncbi:MAG: hypothetical protein JW913_19325, partial [Chitinispirillaceae bacterium]|nr:hypothetical protein [Chitinispirillaceae bacterium]
SPGIPALFACRLSSASYASASKRIAQFRLKYTPRQPPNELTHSSLYYFYKPPLPKKGPYP